MCYLFLTKLKFPIFNILFIWKTYSIYKTLPKKLKHFTSQHMVQQVLQNFPGFLCHTNKREKLDLKSGPRTLPRPPHVEGVDSTSWLWTGTFWIYISLTHVLILKHTIHTYLWNTTRYDITHDTLTTIYTLYKIT